ncbi:MAG: hypothetical protein DDT30_01349 [Dehalococcoidia bacterium]|nr:hypothetical protein [Bacillota bacterium]
MPAHTILRAAVVQLDYQPAASLAYPYLEEPALLNEGEQGIATLPPDLPNAETLQAFRSEVREAYHKAVLHRATSVLKKLNAIGVDIVVFPEYSIPASCLEEIGHAAGSAIVVAASHTVTSDTLGLCNDLFIQRKFM